MITIDREGFYLVFLKGGWHAAHVYASRRDPDRLWVEVTGFEVEDASDVEFEQVLGPIDEETIPAYAPKET